MSDFDRESSGGSGRHTPAKGTRTISTSHQVSVATVITQGFDALVRATRQRDGGLTGMAQRVLSSWMQVADEPMMLKPDGLWFAGELGAAVTEDACWWLLPAFMAGVREIHLDDDAHPEDMVRLAQEVGMLELGGAALETFRDWVWADGAEGFELAMSLSFSEVFEMLDTGEVDASMFGAPRAASLVSMDTTRVALPSAEIAAASLRPEFHASLDMFSQGLKYRAFELTKEAMGDVTQRIDDGGHWTWAETDAILTHKVLRDAIDPWRLSRRVMSRMRSGLGEMLLTRLVAIYKDPEPFFDTMRQALEREGCPTVVSRALDLSSARVRDLTLEWLAARNETEGLGWVAMFVRATRDDAFAQNLATMVREREVDAVRRLLDEGSLAEDVAVAYARVMIAAGCSPTTLSSIMGNLNVDASAVVMAELSDIYLASLDRPLVDALHNASNGAIEVLVPSLIARRQPGLLQLIGQALNTRREPWMRKILNEACTAIVDADMARLYLVPLVRTRSVGDAAREIALSHLGRREDVLEEAVRFRFSEFFETQEFRERIKTDRKRLRDKKRTQKEVEE